MSGRALLRTLSLAALVSCSHNPPPRLTRVDREQRVTADTPARTQWFATLYLLQRTLASADARRLDVLAPLQVMLCLPPDAELSRIGPVAQARLAHGNFVRMPIRLRRTAESEQALARWVESAATLNGDASERTDLAAIEASLLVERTTPTGVQALTLPAVDAPFVEPRCEPGVTEGTQGAEAPEVLTRLALLLRRSSALALVFQRAVVLAGDLRSQLPTVSAGATGALAAEFRASERALVGVATRATMQLHDSARNEQWTQLLLIPEGSEEPDAVPDVSPDDNDPREYMPDPGAMDPDASVLGDAAPTGDAAPADVPVPVNSYVGDAAPPTDAQVWSDVFVGHDNRPRHPAAR